MKSPAPGPARWQKLTHTTLAQTRVFDLHSTRYRHPVRETERDFIIAHPPDWVNVVALTPDQRIVLVRQFRFGIDGFSLEIPGGVMERGEDPVIAGLRELREETGYAGAPARLMGSVHPNPAIQSNRCHFVLVEQAVAATATEWDADEEIEISTQPVEDVLALAHAGGITHGLVLDALLFFEQHWRTRLKPRG
jgi:8-oxo-dGTP pyrophosphatase MutT (NUDIX family)